MAQSHAQTASSTGGPAAGAGGGGGGGRSGQVVRISLETWLAQTKLDDEEEASVRLVQNGLSGLQNAQDAKTTDQVNGLNGPKSEHDRLEKANGEDAVQKDELHGFQEWLKSTEGAMEDEQEAASVNFLESVTLIKAACDEVVERVNTANELFLAMTEDHEIVEERASALHNACEELLDEQLRLSEVAGALTARLEFFSELETVTRILNLPAEKIVLTDDFLSMLDRLDMCLDFFQANTSYKDAELYIVRYEQCMTRAMTLIKIYFISVIQSTATDALQKIANQKIGETATHALLYDKFRASSESLRNLLAELSGRSQRDDERFGAILSECHLAYCSARLQLLMPNITDEIAKINQGENHLLRTARSGYSYILEVCHSEFDLWHCFFTGDERPLYTYLGSLSGALNDLLRPRILREVDLNLLSQLCVTLQSMVAMELAQEPDEREGNTQSGVSMTYLLRDILQDVQSRLIFRAQQLIDAEVRYYRPKPTDLRYPAILLEATQGQGVREGTKAINVLDDENKDYDPIKMPLQSEQETWYHTVKKVVWILSKLYTYLDSVVFDGLAQDAISACLGSLMIAKEQIENTSTKRDAQLFVLRHLFILQNHIARFDSQLSRAGKGYDFTRISTTLEDLRSASRYFNPFIFMRLAQKGIDRVEQSLNDARVHLDDESRAHQEQVISSVVEHINAPLDEWLADLKEFQADNMDDAHLKDQSFATVKHLESVLENYGSRLKGLHDQIESIGLYIDNRQISEGIVKTIRNQIDIQQQAFILSVKVIWPTGAQRMTDLSSSTG